MALHNQKLRQKGRKMSGIAFKELQRLIDKNSYQINLKTVREAKKIDCLKHHFKATDESLRDNFDKRVLGGLVANIKQETAYDIDIPAITYNPSTKKHEFISDIEKYLNKKSMEWLRAAIRYTEHKPDIQKQLDQILAELEKDI